MLLKDIKLLSRNVHRICPDNLQLTTNYIPLCSTYSVIMMECTKSKQLLCNFFTL